MGILNQMFGVASSASYIRAGGSGTLAKNLVVSLVKGYGGNSGDGVYVYNVLNTNNVVGFSQYGFDSTSSYYNTLEVNVPVISYPSNIGVGAIIYSYANFQNYPKESIVSIINSFCEGMEELGYGPQPKFSLQNLNASLDSFSLNSINAEISGSPKGQVKKAINYNWYDSEPLFANPNTSSLEQLIKDTECQYYYLSGELIYSNIPTGLKPCVPIKVNISTPTGDIVIQKFKEIPCYAGNSYTGPISGIKFFRKFLDGPSSSGFFDLETMDAYIEMEKSVTDYRDYASNRDIIFSSKMDESGFFIPLRSGVVSDYPGQFQSGREYGWGYTNVLTDTCCRWNRSDFKNAANTFFTWENYTGTGLPFMRMHQWDKNKKWELIKVCHYENSSCVFDYYTGILHNWTGWKLATFELKPELATRFVSCKTNPIIDTGRVIKRALDLNNDLVNNQVISPYASAFDTGDGVITCGDIGLYDPDYINSYYVGSPQLNGDCALPGFAFYQTFDNKNFPMNSVPGEYASITIRPMVTQGQNSFSVSDYLIFSGKDGVHHNIGNNQASINFYFEIPSSGQAAKDAIFRKCFSIGDNFNNAASGSGSLQANAGYLYSGYSYLQNGVPVSLSNLLENSKKVAAKYSTVKYPIGYKSGKRSFYVNTQLGYRVTGEQSTGITEPAIPQKYEYFNSGVLGADVGYWQDTAFAPVPQNVIDEPSIFSTIYASAPVENYFPRYEEGPYLSYGEVFLYPNASTLSKSTKYALGFPTGVTIVMSIKEETVRELFLASGFYDMPRKRKVIRANKSGEMTTLETIMSNPFVPNDPTYAYKYDFLRNKAIYPNEGGFFNSASLNEYLVNENYIPDTDYCPQTELNSTVYHYNSQPFNQGVRVTGTVRSRKIFGKGGTQKTISVIEPDGGGIYWGYRGVKTSGTLLYCPPLFDLEKYAKNPSENLTSSMLDDIYENSSMTCSNDGFVKDDDLYQYDEQFGYYSQYNGKDPLFYEYVGGRSGEGAEFEGGYHSKGIIGDSWYKVSALNFGESYDYCGLGRRYFRDPQNDDYLILSEVTPTGLRLFTRGLDFYPYYLNWKYQPFKSSSIGNIGVSVSAKSMGSEYYFDFNLKDHFYPIADGNNDNWYLDSGLTIGPFDRDVEFCITGEPIIPRGSLFIDGRQITDPSWTPYSYCVHEVNRISQNSGIVLGQAGRGTKISTFHLIPSGKKTNINISGIGKIGVTGNAKITIRPRTCFGAASLDYSSDFDSLSGDFGYLDSLRYINNGTESMIPFTSATIEELAGKKFSKTTAPREEILYPRPSPLDFDLVLKPSTDAFGNKLYRKNPTKEYWRVRSPDALFSGIREATRINISIDSVKVLLGPYPYSQYEMIVPSGSCIVSGSFGYTGQAESAILSDGIVLTGFSGASSLTGVFKPTYVSNVLERLPEQIYKLPSGSGIYPILPAPSYMKIRENPFVITGNDKYISASPSGLNYNTFLWPAWSDLALLNPEVVYEQLPKDDVKVFSDSYLTFSAAQGQPIGTGFNLSENVTYVVTGHYGFIDSVATNALYNTGKCILSGIATKTQLNSGDLSGILTSEGTSLTMALNLGSYKL